MIVTVTFLNHFTHNLRRRRHKRRDIYSRPRSASFCRREIGGRAASNLLYDADVLTCPISIVIYYKTVLKRHSLSLTCFLIVVEFVNF